MLRHLGIAAIDRRFVKAGLGDARLQIVGDHHRRYAADERESAGVRADPVGQALRPGCQTARNVDPQSASKTDPALREVFGSLGPAIAEICGAGSGSTPTDLRVLLPSWSGIIC